MQAATRLVAAGSLPQALLHQLVGYDLESDHLRTKLDAYYALWYVLFASFKMDEGLLRPAHFKVLVLQE
jgi:hypothetical protein